MPALNYDEDPNYQQAVRQRVQQRLSPGAGVDPTSPTAPPISSVPKAGFNNPSAPQSYQPPAYPTPGSTTLQSPAGYKGPDYSGYPGSYGGAPGQFNFTDPTNRPSPVTGGASTAPFDIEQWGQGWANSGGRTNQDFSNYLAAHPLGAGYSVTGNSKDRISGPNGYTRDAVLAAGLGGQGAQWLDTTQQGAAPGGPAPSATGTSNPFLESIRAMLLQRLQADQQPVDENAPQIAQPFQAAALQSQRGQEGLQRALKERLYAQGDLNSGAFTQQSQQGAEQAATGLAGIKSGLIQKEYAARRQDLSEALQLAIASGDAQMAREVQLQISALDAQLRREGYGVSLAENEAGQNANTVIAGLNG